MIKGITLRNFMSYESAYVPLENGLNLVCGPNGAGKSSILLAISVVLGQTYTERARRLSDLIRWGEEQARITLSLNNMPRGGRRPFPQYRTDTVNVTRILKRDGNYFYLIQDKPVSKGFVSEIFNDIGLNPDNMFVIMHQLMLGKFSSISPQERLQMLEEAVGFQSYRKDVSDAYQQLRKIVDEERSFASILESTKETYDYWKREYEKYLLKKDLETKLERLKGELLWSRIRKREETLSKFGHRIKLRKQSIERAASKINESSETLKRHELKFNEMKEGRRQLEVKQIELAKKCAYREADLKWFEKTEGARKRESSTLEAVIENAKGEGAGTIPPPADQTLSFLEKQLSEAKEEQMEAKDASAKLTKELRHLEIELTSLQKQISELAKEIEKELSSLIDAKVEFEVSIFKKKLLVEELKDLEVQFRMFKEELAPLIAKARKLGPRVDARRKILDIMADMSVVEERLKPLASVSEDVEKMYSSYTGLFQDLQEKAEAVVKNRQKVQKELDRRLEKWKDVLTGFIAELNEKYNAILSEVGATGLVRLVESKEIEKCGIEILAGFKWAKPTPLDGFAQSGGERSVALMAFLLALQQHVTSPFRAIDEFDVHMDPKNREAVSRLIVSSSKRIEGEQYLAITPGQVTLPDENVHVIVVQNVGGSSAVGEMAQ